MQLSVGVAPLRITRCITNFILADKTMRNRSILWANLSWLVLSGCLAPLAIGQTVPPDRTLLAALNRPTLTTGSRSAEVAELQAALRLLGYYAGPVDSVYGETTIAAVTRFQQAAGLTADGIVGNATWERLFPARPGTPTTAPRPTADPATYSSAPGNLPANRSTSNPAPESATVSLPLLKLGMKGAAVIGLQERLRALGLFDGAIDGVFGPATQAAVKAAQSKFKLDADGVVGPTTWSVLLREK